MNNKFHKTISYMKSVIRLLSSIVSVVLTFALNTNAGIVTLAVGYLIAELLGILEERIGTD